VIFYDANGAAITPTLARRTMADAFAAHHSAGKWAMRIEQRCAIENLAITAQVVHEEEIKGALDRHLADRDMTLCGLPIDVDERIPFDEIELRDKSGLTISRIKNLAVIKNFSSRHPNAIF
jgi:hypothetical protein